MALAFPRSISSVSRPAESCQLFDNFAIGVQLLLVLSALVALVVKRLHETPRRPIQIWALDVSKQFAGAGIVHFLNLGVSYLAGRPAHGPHTNLCVWYFLNVALDTTAGVAILWVWLQILETFLRWFTGHQFRSGHYGPPPLRSMLRVWMWQTLVFITAAALMKMCILVLFQTVTCLFQWGDAVLNFIGRANYRHQVVFVMFVFPMMMNAFQFCVIDSIIKVQKTRIAAGEPKQWQKDQQSMLSALPPILVVHTVNERSPLL